MLTFTLFLIFLAKSPSSLDFVLNTRGIVGFTVCFLLWFPLKFSSDSSYVLRLVSFLNISV